MKEGDAPMPSRRRYSQSLTEHPRERIDAACQIAGSDQTATSTNSGVVDDAGPSAITPVDGYTVRGRPDGGRIVHMAYSDHEALLTSACFASRVDGSPLNGRAPAFVGAQPGPSKRDLAAHSLLASRATSMHTDAVR
jgi:hypothetical protein